MKILKLRFKNINSIEGEWSIDFTDTAYISEGIFAITGPTGAGKSTILDAITLGLYAQTPRLGKITGSFNELMSRKTGECFAQVTFESSKGIFVSHFSQHRSKRKPGGNLQPPKHEIFDDNGKIIETGLSKVPNIVKDKTGMDFERFTKSILLAQGGFAAFLEASPAQRAPILEEITGTEIYSEISIKVHEKKRDESLKLEKLEAEVSGITLLDNEEENNLKDNLDKLKQDEEKSKNEVNNLNEKINWLIGIDKIEDDLIGCKKDFEILSNKDKELEPEKKRLVLGNKALLVDKFYEILKEKRAVLEKNKNDLSSFKSLLPQKEADLYLIEKSKNIFDEELKLLKSKKVSKLQIIKEVREKDIVLNQQKTQISEVEIEVKKINESLKKEEKRKEEIENSFKEINIEFEKADKYLSENINNKRLVDEFYEIKSLADYLNKNYEKEDRLEKEIKLKTDEIKSHNNELDNIKEQFKEKEKIFKQKSSFKKDLNRNLKDFLADKELKDIRKELNDCENQKTGFIKLKELLFKINEEEKKLNKNLFLLDENKIKIEKIGLELNSDKIELEKVEKIIKLIQKEISILSKIADLEQERKRLEQGKPCPLCGSISHPYFDNTPPQILDEEKELKKEESKKDFILKRIEAKKEDNIKTESDLKNLKLRIDENRNNILKLKQENQTNLNLSGIKEGISQKDIDKKESNLDNKISEIKILINKIEEIENKIKINQKELDDIDKDYSLIEKNKINLENKISNKEDLSKKLFSELELLKDDILLKFNDFKFKLKYFNIIDFTRDNINKIMIDLHNRLESWKKNHNLKSDLEKVLNNKKNQLESADKILSNLINDKESKAIILNEKNNFFDKLLFERKEIFGDKNPDVEEDNIEKEIINSESKFSDLSKKYINLKEKIFGLKENIKSLENFINLNEKELNDSKDKFLDKLKSQGFLSEEDYLASCLDDDEIQSLREKTERVEKEISNLKSLIKNLEDKFFKEKEKKLTDKNLEELNNRKDILDKEISEINKKTGEINSLVLQNEKNRNRLKDKLEDIEKQKKEWIKWNNLHDLIGSADGKKFRNFAQGLTFEIMVNLANKQLKDMTDRYLLIRDIENPLELNVLDNYQAGEIRSSKNLSGGEGFLVSLCLALGLSNMAGKNIKVDSLFLDEGFGTLDDESLETALETLSKLNQSGKVIGIISHVQALKERVPVQINVEPLTGGRSFIIGPGCKKLA